MRSIGTVLRTSGTALRSSRARRQIERHRVPSFVPSIADALVLKDRDLFLVTDRAGRIPAEAGHGFGLFLHDCRFLGAYELRLEGQLLDVLAADASHGTIALLILTNAQPISPFSPSAGGGRVAKQQLVVRWRRALDGAKRTLHDKLTIRNAGPTRARVTLSLDFGSRFEDIFEIRGLLRERGGRHLPPAWHGDALRLAYQGRDRFVRCLWVQFDPAPTDEHGPRATFVLDIEAGRSTSILLSLTAEEANEVPAAPPAGREPKDPRLADHDRLPPPAPWLEGQAHVATGSVAFDEVLDRSFSDLRMLVSTNGQELYFAAGVPWFVALFGRDSLIAALQILAFDPSIAATTLRTLAARQGTVRDPWRAEEPGKILHELRLGEYAHLGVVPHTPYFGSIDATPLWLCLLGRHALWTGTLELFHELRAHVEAALGWLDERSTADTEGYLAYEGQADGGLLNQGWKDSADAIFDAAGELARPPVRLAEVQGYVYLARRLLADLYERDGQPKRARILRRQAARLRRQFERDFWLPARGHFALGLHDGGRPLESLTSNAGQVLWSGIASRARARRTGQRMLSETMFTGWGVRTLASGEPRFNPIGYHTGTIWPHDNAFIVAGLRRYGLDDEAERIFSGLFEAALEFPAHRLPELFAGFSREEFAEPVPYPVACHPQAWSAGAIPYLVETMLGLEPDGFARVLRLNRPRLPPWLSAVELTGLRVGRGRADLRFVRRHTGSVGVDVLRRDGLEVVEVVG